MVRYEELRGRQVLKPQKEIVKEKTYYRVKKPLHINKIKLDAIKHQEKNHFSFQPNGIEVRRGKIINNLKGKDKNENNNIMWKS